MTRTVVVGKIQKVDDAGAIAGTSVSNQNLMSFRVTNSTRCSKIRTKMIQKEFRIQKFQSGIYFLATAVLALSYVLFGRHPFVTSRDNLQLQPQGQKSVYCSPQLSSSATVPVLSLDYCFTLQHNEIANVFLKVRFITHQSIFHQVSLFTSFRRADHRKRFYSVQVPCILPSLHDSRCFFRIVFFNKIAW